MGHYSDDDRCGTCKNDVTDDDEGVCCDRCDRWYHIQCQGIERRTYNRMMEKATGDWYCQTCKLEPQRDNNRKLMKRMSKLKVGTLNCRGMKTTKTNNTKKLHLEEDLRKYDLDILAIQETLTGGEGPEEITTLDGKDKFRLYHSSTSKQHNKENQHKSWDCNSSQKRHKRHFQGNFRPIMPATDKT